MDFASSYDLINGPVHSKAAFDKAVDATTVPDNVKFWAKTFEVRVWGDDVIPKTVVTQTGPDTLQFEVTGGKVIADVTIQPTSLPLPPDLTLSQTHLRNEILAAQNNYLGACAFTIEDLVYGTLLRLGAIASGTSDTVTTAVYGTNLTTSYVVEPHIRSPGSIV
jgi:hypothetical protein